MCAVMARARPGCARSWLARDGQEARHHRATAAGAVHLDGPVMLLEDAMADGEPETEPARLGGEEGVEDPGPHRLGDARPLVGYLKLDHAARPAAEVHLAEEGVEAHPGRHREVTAALHGLDGVAHQIVND